MEGRIIADLHGHTYQCSDYHVSTHLPLQECCRGGSMVFMGDTLTSTSFILVNRKDSTHGYIFYENKIYIYGELTLQKYEPNRDMRHVKDRN